MLLNINLTKNIHKKAKSLLCSLYPKSSRISGILFQSSSTTSNFETVDLAYSTYDYCGKTSTKPPLIILHAMFGSRNNWDIMGKAIHEMTGRKVISVDARNHGDSEDSPQHSYLHQAYDVIKLLKKLELTKVSILGHCMGGVTAMVLSLIRPDLVTSMVIDDVSPVTISPHELLIVHLVDTLPTLSFPSGISISEARDLADERLKLFVADVSIRNNFLGNLVQTSDGSYGWRINFTALKNNLQANIFIFPPSLEGLQYAGPTLFLGGSRSDYIGKYDLPKIRVYFPSAELIFIEDAGHFIHTQKPEEFLKVLRNFFDGKLI